MSKNRDFVRNGNGGKKLEGTSFLSPAEQKRVSERREANADDRVAMWKRLLEKQEEGVLPENRNHAVREHEREARRETEPNER